MHMKKLIGILVACLFALSAFAQEKIAEAVEVCGEYTYLVPTDMSLDEAKEKALVGAKNEAMGKEFGWAVSEDTKMRDVETDDESHSYFNTYASSEVKGIWLETIGKPKFEVQMDEATGGLKVHVVVKGLARERVSTNIELETKLLRNVNDKSESLSFVSEENFFLYFKSPENGFLTVYLMDETGDAFCLLPYGNQKSGHMPIKADQVYTFFSEQMATDDCKPFVDEYFFFAEKPVEEHKLYILFSPERLTKASDKRGRFLDKANLQMPREVKAQDFHEWLSKQKQMDSHLQVVVKTIELKSE